MKHLAASIAALAAVLIVAQFATASPAAAPAARAAPAANAPGDAWQRFRTFDLPKGSPGGESRKTFTFFTVPNGGSRLAVVMTTALCQCVEGVSMTSVFLSGDLDSQDGLAGAAIATRDRATTRGVVYADPGQVVEVTVWFRGAKSAIGSVVTVSASGYWTNGS